MKILYSTLLAAISLCLLSCAAKENPKPTPAGELTISVAASAAEVFEELTEDFTAKTNVQVKINAGPSSGLANQILSGAPVDLFLSANRSWADKVKEAGLAESSTALLTNKLVVVVPKGNPAGIHAPEDLLSDKVSKVALAGENVPAGIYANQALTKLNLLEPLTSNGKIARGQDVRSALSYVERGEAEAGIVYSTDLAAANVELAFAFDPWQHDEIVYMLVLLEHGASKPAARELMEFLQAAEAEKVYAKAGFERLLTQ